MNKLAKKSVQAAPTIIESKDPEEFTGTNVIQMSDIPLSAAQERRKS